MMDIVLFVMMHFSGAADESVSVEDYTKKVDAYRKELAEGRKLANELGKTSGGEK